MPLVAAFVCSQLLSASLAPFFNRSDSILHQLPAWKIPFECQGKIVAPVDSAGDQSRLVVALEKCRQALDQDWQQTSGRIRLTVLKPYQHFQQGDFLRFKSGLKLPVSFRNPGSFNFARRLEVDHIVATGFVADPKWVVVVSQASPGFQNVRENLVRAIPAGENPEARSLLLSLLMNDRSGLSATTQEIFQETGTSHLLAISGLHVAMWVGIVGVFLWPFALWIGGRGRSILEIAAIASLPMVWGYVAVAGFPVPALRAALMATPLLIAFYLRWRLSPLKVLGLAAFVILSLWPKLIFQASFQLTFAAVASLILFSPRLRRWKFLAITATVTIGLLPLLLYHFHTLSFLGLLANVLAVPTTEFLIMPLLLIGWIFSGCLGWPMTPLWKAALYFAHGLLRGLSILAGWAPWGVWHGGIEIWEMIVYYGILLLLLLPRAPKKILWGSWALCVAIIFARGPMVKDQLKITFLDVGQGDSAVIELPNGKVWVLDGGGIKGSDFDVGRAVVAPFLWQQNIRWIDRLILSHPHHDHYKGLEYLLAEFSPRELYWNGDAAPDSESEDWEEFLAVLQKSQVPTVAVTSATEPLQEGEVRLEFLAPAASGTKSYWDTNDNSIVAKLTYREVSFLLAGDLMTAGEEMLLDHPAALASMVLKLGHHGSRTSTGEKFLEAVHPKFAVMSVGTFNQYGLPDEEVLDRLSAKNIKLFRTDHQGAIEVMTTGHSLAWRPFVRSDFPTRPPAIRATSFPE